jgi:hypothetical protein
MKIRLGNWFVRLGASPTEDNNYASVERGAENSLLRVSACAEEYDSSLGFYMEVCGALGRSAESCWFELRDPTRRKIPKEIDRGACWVGYTNGGALYSVTAPHRIVSLVSEFWPSNRFRILGTDRISSVAAVELATSLHKGLKGANQKLSESVVFVSEKQYFADQSLLVVLVRSSALNSSYDLVVRSATRLKRPLLEVGPASWPPLS